jgi:hypothetical protein
MSLALYGHPFSSSSAQNVLIALYENVGHSGPPLPRAGYTAALGRGARRWPLGKLPLLVDGEREPRPASLAAGTSLADDAPAARGSEWPLQVRFFALPGSTRNDPGASR